MVSTVPAGSGREAVCVEWRSVLIRLSKAFGTTSVRHPAFVAEMDWPRPNGASSTIAKSSGDG
eukprot:73083-Prymnesium_polylepis.1